MVRIPPLGIITSIICIYVICILHKWYLICAAALRLVYGFPTKKYVNYGIRLFSSDFVSPVIE